MLDSLKEALTSKKFLATIIGAVVVAVGQGVGLSEDQSLKISGMIIAYVIGQGVADSGPKEAEKAKAKLAAQTDGLSAAEKAAALEG